VAVSTPVWAQDITAPGLKGAPACDGRGETIDIDLFDISAVSQNSAMFGIKAYSNLFSVLNGREGGGGPYSLSLQVHPARGGSRVFNLGFSINSGLPNLGASTQDATGLQPKTTYYAEMTVAGISGAVARRCFMTGGTYTPTNNVLNNGSTGCFSIPGLSRHDIRNCLCGRKSSGGWWKTDGTEQERTNRNNATSTQLGCAN